MLRRHPSGNCFTANPGYVAPSVTTVKRIVDLKFEEKKVDLKDEIMNDLKKAGPETVSITFDGGQLNDRLKTKKNTLTLSRTCADFEIRTDTLGCMDAVGSQSGPVIRQKIKNSFDVFGHSPDWSVNATTDGAPNVTAARTPGRFPHTGLQTNHTATCKDHTINLIVEESLGGNYDIEAAVRKVRQLVAYLNYSALAQAEFLEIEVEVG